MQDREQLWRAGKDEPVEVNQRALIDKVLARYSGEFTLFRELLQNSDDAESKKAEIHFQTEAYLARGRKNDENMHVPALPNLKATSVTQWMFRNNGAVFQKEDWDRLLKIAEGNPRAGKVGTFGVGFYSLFSVTERPFVSSGEHWMQFYWKDNKDQLYVRRGNFPSSEIPNSWTTFEMSLHEVGPIPPTLELMRFLASSITFMVHLSEVGVFVDDYCIGRIKKSPGTTQAVGIPGALRCSGPSDIMNVQEIRCHSITIDAEIVRAVYTAGTRKSASQMTVESRDKGSSSNQLLPLPGTPTSEQQRESTPRITLDLTLYTAQVHVKACGNLSAAIRRSTKKDPPKQLTYSLIYTGKDANDRSMVDQNGRMAMCDSVFQGLRADLNGALHTRVFIGHATGQTTGMGGHMASSFIPTVERESIDLVDRNVAVWNKELLYIGGFLSRVVYELELSKIQDTWEGAGGLGGALDVRQSANLLHQHFLHILKFFTFHHSTPSARVARLLEDAFYGCSASPLRLLSSAGVHLASEIKEYDRAVAAFVKYLPILPEYVVRECPRVVEALPEQHKVLTVTFSEILQDLRKHILTQDELTACLRWWLDRRDASARNLAQLSSAITFSSAHGSPLQLSSVTCFVGPEFRTADILPDGPLPASLISHNISKKFTAVELKSFGWREFTVLDWFRHISQPEILSADPRHDFTQSMQWAEHTLGVLSTISLPESDMLYRLVKSMFTGKNCIPTSHGLRSPEESFLQASGANATLFQDLNLPIVHLNKRLEINGGMEKLLLYVGVRKQVPLQLLFDKMFKTGNWSVSNLVNYLVRVQDSLTEDEFSKLASLEIFTKEGAKGDGSKFRIIDLYPPLDIFRQLQLPVIDWAEGWEDELDQAKLLYHLGLRRYPPLEEVVMLSSTAPDPTLSETAFGYLCKNLRLSYSHYNPEDFWHIPFIPAENEHGTCLAKPGDVFLDTRWKVLGFAAVQDSYQKSPSVIELGVQQHPPASMLIQQLETNPPTNGEVAREWFECLCGCISSFSKCDLSKLSKMPIVPIRSSTGWLRLAPIQCCLGEGMKDEFLTKLFAFVDFGYAANNFLRACGSRNEPSVKDIAECLVEDPKRFYTLAGGHEGGFLAELRNLASQSRRIPINMLEKMMSRPILLGMRRREITDEGESGYECALRKPREIIIADDISLYQLFQNDIFVAPQDWPGLEDFYVLLGCRRLSTMVEEKFKVSNEVRDTKTSSEVRSLVLLRLPLFLRDHNHTQFQAPVLLPHAEHFKVKVCERLVVSKTLAIGNDPITRFPYVSAVTRHGDEGHVELWLSGAAEPDMYEIASSLCRLLFGTAKVSDTLLLTAILSTPLEVLERRGYNVGKIPRQHGQRLEAPGMAEELIDNCFVELHAVMTTSATNDIVPEQTIVTIGPSTVTLSAGSSTSHQISGGCVPQSENTPTSNRTRSAIPNFARRLVLRERATGNTQSVTFPQQPRTLRQVMPQSYIRATVERAMKACRPEGGKLLHHRNKVEEIREFPNEGYCDVSGHIGKLKRRGKIGQVHFFTTEDVPDPDASTTSMHDMFVRFVNVLIPLAELYGLSLALLHVFYDIAGGPIAFNREGSIFLNLRYFEAWHDQDVQKGSLQQAQVSWFYALAHELAHNLIKQHNSEHEFWFSAICEAYAVPFSRLLKGTTD